MKVGRFKQLDWPLVLLVVVLLTISVAMIYSLTAGRVSANLALDQAGFAVIGLILCLGLSQLDYRQLRLAALPLLVLGLLFLGAVLLVGTTVFGATRWIDLFGFQFQPSELMKLFLVLFAGHLLTNHVRSQYEWQNFILLVLAAVLATVLVLFQPDLGTAAVFTLVVASMFVAAGLPKSYWVGLAAAAVVGFPILVARLQDYQLQRLRTFFRPTDDPLGAGYNVLQSLIAVGNGGLFGQGFGQGTQSQLDFLPVVHTDFIFAGIAESVGFVGSVLLLLLLGALLLRGLRIAQGAPDRFGMLLAVGISSLWFVQIAVNISMNLGLAPVTGIPLPFVSYGGTALIVNCCALGVLLSVARRSGVSRSW